MSIIRLDRDKDKNIWGKLCDCGNVSYAYFNDHVFSEDNITKEVFCPVCKKKNK